MSLVEVRLMSNIFMRMQTYTSGKDIYIMWQRTVNFTSPSVLLRVAMLMLIMRCP